ncbi:MAG: glutathione S-transferase family protein [Alphaproteobacteria bacterium]|nr:glutathione S-transferase family protein [Alphaproteobacteria bacterium]
MLTIWGRKNSSNVMPVLWAADELGLTYDHKMVGGSFGGLDTAAFKAMNPNQRVPVLQDGDFVLFESNAIVRHLARSAGQGSLLPDGLQAQAHADQWLDWHKTTLTLPMIDLFWGTVRCEPEQRNPDLIAKAKAATDKALAILDDHLAGRDFMVMDRLTLADIPLGALVYRYYQLQIEHQDFQNLTAWYARLQDRPAYQKNVMIPFGTTLAEWNELERALV